MYTPNPHFTTSPLIDSDGLTTTAIVWTKELNSAAALEMHLLFFDLLVEEIAYVAEINNSLAVTKTGHGSGSLMPI